MDFPKTYCIYDLETTGLDTDRDEAIEIGAMMVHEGKEPMIKSWLIRPSIRISKEAEGITGITNEMVAEKGMSADDAWDEFIDFAGLSYMAPMWPLMGHNIYRFDNQIVERAINKMGFSLKGWPFIDTAALYKAHKLGEEKRKEESHEAFIKRILDTRAFGLTYNLFHVFRDLGGDPAGIQPHRAEADVRMTQFVYHKLAALEELKKQPVLPVRGFGADMGLDLDRDTLHVDKTGV